MTRLLVNIRSSKTDQERAGPQSRLPAVMLLALPRRAAGMAGRGWYRVGPDLSADRQGRNCADFPAYRSVADIVKANAERAGFDASTFSGHSLRASFLTSAAGEGTSIFKMMDVSRHKSVDTLRGYVRDAELFKDHAGTGLL